MYYQEVGIDKVYQKVLALTNKEQRGYITPQEFNLLADKAQNEIFENYFHDIKTAQMKPKTQTDYSDIIESVEERLTQFIKVNESLGGTPSSSSTFGMQTDIYKIISIEYNGKKAEQLNNSEITYTQSNPLTAATLDRPVWVRTQPTTSGQAGTLYSPRIAVYPIPSTTNPVVIKTTYYCKPTTPKWGYVVVKGRALYNSGATTNFMLHVAEEENLVSRILQSSGVVIQKPDIQQAAAVDKQTTVQEQNN